MNARLNTKKAKVKVPHKLLFQVISPQIQTNASGYLSNRKWAMDKDVDL